MRHLAGPNELKERKFKFYTSYHFMFFTANLGCNPEVAVSFIVFIIEIAIMK